MSDTPRMNSIPWTPICALYTEGCKLERELIEARRELETLRSDDGLNTRILKQHAEQIAELQQERCELEEQLTAHKEAVVMCEMVITTALHNNGGVIGFDSTTDSKEYVMVLSGDFNGLELTIAAIAKLKEGK